MRTALVYLICGLWCLWIRDYRNPGRPSTVAYRFYIIALWPVYVVLIAGARLAGWWHSIFR